MSNGLRRGRLRRGRLRRGGFTLGLTILLLLATDQMVLAHQHATATGSATSPHKHASAESILTAIDPWLREVPVAGASGAVYMHLRNASDSAVRIVGVLVEGAASADIHEVVSVRVRNQNSEARPNPAEEIAGSGAGHGHASEHAQQHPESGGSSMHQMRPYGRPLLIPAGQQVSLEPGGLHVMVESLARPLPEGEQLELIFRLDNGQELKVRAMVRAMNSQAPMHHGH